MVWGARCIWLIELIEFIGLIELTCEPNQPLTIHSFSFPRRFNPKSQITIPNSNISVICLLFFIPHSAFPIPHSKLCHFFFFPNSAFHIQNSVILCPLSSGSCYRPPMIYVDAADRSQHIGNHIQKATVSIGDERLVNFITDAVKGSGYHTEQHQQLHMVFERQGLISPVKQSTHNGIRCKMQQLVTEFK